MADAWNAPPSILYSKAAPVGTLTTMVPVGTVHVGCTVTDAVGVAGGVLTVTVIHVNVADEARHALPFKVEVTSRR